MKFCEIPRISQNMGRTASLSPCKGEENNPLTPKLAPFQGIFTYRIR